MNLHEYQAKQLFAEYGLPVPQGVAISSVKEVAAACDQIGGAPYVVKVQVHAGGRGKAGGVKVVQQRAEAEDFSRQWLGQRLVTHQTGSDGQPVGRVLVEQACPDIARELYLGAVVDRSSARVVFMASTEGGVDIESVATETPEKILRATIDPLSGPQPYQGRQLAFALGLDAAEARQFTDIFLKLGRLFLERDLSLLEVNPLVVTGDGKLLCLDAKLNVDGNALYRQRQLQQMDDSSQRDEREVKAEQHELNYVALDGDIACMVNGAGLAMGTMDMIQLYGGTPANFLDVGGGATHERVSAAFRILLASAAVRAVLVNIFGGIVRCDLIAEGIIGAVGDVGVKLPVIVRLQGNRAEDGLRLLADSGLNIIAVSALADAAKRVVDEARSSAGATP